MKPPRYRLILATHGTERVAMKELLSHLGLPFGFAGTRRELPDDAAAILGGSSERDEADALAGSTGIPFLSIKDCPELPRITRAYEGAEDRAPTSDPLEPVVTRLEQSFEHMIQERLSSEGFPFVKKWYWPNFASAAFVLTHDIDLLTYTGSYLKTWPARRAIFLMTRPFKTGPYTKDLERLAGIEDRWGLASTYFMFPEYGPAVPTELVHHVMSGLKRQGKEIGLHGSWSSSTDSAILMKEVGDLRGMLGAEIAGIRQHGLKFSVPWTWSSQQAAGLAYDASFFHNDWFGFRSGLCHPFHPINGNLETPMSILEIPTAFMDYTAIRRGLRFREWMGIIDQLCVSVIGANGCAVFDYHQSYFNRILYPEVVKSYERICERSSAKTLWRTTAGECARWWIDRENAATTFDLSREEYKSSMPLVVVEPGGAKRRVPGSLG